MFMCTEPANWIACTHTIEFGLKTMFRNYYTILQMDLQPYLIIGANYNSHPVHEIHLAWSIVVYSWPRNQTNRDIKLK